MTTYFVYHRAPNATYPFWHYHFAKTSYSKDHLPNITVERPVFVYDDVPKTYMKIGGFVINGVQYATREQAEALGRRIDLTPMELSRGIKN